MPAGSHEAMRWLVTGGGGFVLAHVVRRILRSDATAMCVVVDRHVDGVVEEFWGGDRDRIEIVGGDVRDKAMWDGLRGQFSHVVSGAALTPTASEEREELAATIFDVNVCGHCRALEFASKISARLAYLSSNAALGDDESLYATSKRAAEAATRRMRDVAGLDAVIVRPSDVYGELDRDTASRKRHNAPYYVRKNRRIKIKWDPRPLEELRCFDLVDAESVAGGVVLAATRGKRAGEYNLASGRAIPLVEVARASGLPITMSTTEYDFEVLPASHWLLTRGPMDVEPARTDLGWSAAPLERALRTYLA